MFYRLMLGLILCGVISASTNDDNFAAAVEHQKSKRYEQAYQLFQQLAEKDHVPAQFKLGVMYENGQGVKRDYKQALIWYTKAADRNYGYAQNNLGLMYFYGKGIKKDYRKAETYVSLAALKGLERAKKNLEIISNLKQGNLVPFSGKRFS